MNSSVIKALFHVAFVAFGLFSPATFAAEHRTGAADAANKALLTYRAELEAFRAEYGGVRSLPAVTFFQFGMGRRAKYLFKNGTLYEATNGKAYRTWTAVQPVIVPCDYSVSFTTAEGGWVRVFEDETAVWIEENGRKKPVAGTRKPVRLPRFAGHRYGSILRELHHEILINVINGKPVPNFLVYRKPWYRDGAMMAMCLKKTGNIEVIRDWILGLTEVFDRNNAGETEADNPVRSCT